MERSTILMEEPELVLSGFDPFTMERVHTGSVSLLCFFGYRFGILVKGRSTDVNPGAYEDWYV